MTLSAPLNSIVFNRLSRFNWTAKNETIHSRFTLCNSAWSADERSSPSVATKLCRKVSFSLVGSEQWEEYWINLVNLYQYFLMWYQLLAAKWIQFIELTISFQLKTVIEFSLSRPLFHHLFSIVSVRCTSDVHYKNYSTILLSPNTMQYQFIIYIMGQKIIDHYRCINYQRGFNSAANVDKSTDWMRQKWKVWLRLLLCRRRSYRDNSWFWTKYLFNFIKIDVKQRKLQHYFERR